MLCQGTVFPVPLVHGPRYKLAPIVRLILLYLIVGGAFPVGSILFFRIHRRISVVRILIGPHCYPDPTSYICACIPRKMSTRFVIEILKK